MLEDVGGMGTTIVMLITTSITDQLGGEGGDLGGVLYFWLPCFCWRPTVATRYFNDL